MVCSGSMPLGSIDAGWAIGMFARIRVPFGPDTRVLRFVAIELSF
jgi:hypothetical protein